MPNNLGLFVAEFNEWFDLLFTEKEKLNMRDINVLLYLVWVLESYQCGAARK